MSHRDEAACGSCGGSGRARPGDPPGSCPDCPASAFLAGLDLVAMQDGKARLREARTAPVPAGLRCRGPMGVVLESGAGI